jgi:hypothetical protein
MRVVEGGQQVNPNLSMQELDKYYKALKASYTLDGVWDLQRLGLTKELAELTLLHYGFDPAADKCPSEMIEHKRTLREYKFEPRAMTVMGRIVAPDGKMFDIGSQGPEASKHTGRVEVDRLLTELFSFLPVGKGPDKQAQALLVDLIAANADSIVQVLYPLCEHTEVRPPQ